MDRFNYYVLLIWTSIPAVILTLSLVCCVACTPCIIKDLHGAFIERASRNAVVNAVVRSKFNPEDFKEHTECAICMNEFAENEDVTPLPCNSAHYFHTECITPWLKTNNTCPMCRKEVNAAGFDSLR